MPLAHAVSITAPMVNNPGFENDSCPKDQDHLTCGWLINTQDCTFTAVCANIVSNTQAPEGSHMLSLNGTSGQAQQNNDILSNVTGTIAQTPAFEFFARWNTITSCQTVRTACLLKILFAFDSDTITANFYWTNNATIFSASFVNASSVVFISLAPYCGSLVASASFCHYYNPNFMSQLQTYFNNALVSYGYGQGTGTQHGITINYSLDVSFGCYIISPGICTTASWGLNLDYLVVGHLPDQGPGSTVSTPSLILGQPAILIYWLMASLIAGSLVVVAYSGGRKRR